METEYIIIAVNVALFIIIPYLPDMVFTHIIDNYFAAAVLLGMLLYSITYGYLVAVSTFTSVLSFYVESHKRKVLKIKPVEKPVEPMSITETVVDEVHPPVDVPDSEEVEFLPKDDTGTDDYEAVDTKEVLPTASDSKEAVEVLEKESE
jgi:hypothetical protein